MKDFLKFLTDNLNLNYIEDDYKVIKPSTASGKLLTAINRVQKLKENQKVSETLMRISKNPFEDISKFYSAFISFNNMLNDKEELFNRFVDTASKQAIEEHKNIIVTNIDSMLQAINTLGGDSSDIR